MSFFEKNSAQCFPQCVATGVVCFLFSLPVFSLETPKYPLKPLRIVVPFPPGGTADVVMRSISRPLALALGQSVMIDNRPGANTIIATQIVAHSPNDGYTLLSTGFPFISNAVFEKNLGFDTERDFSAVARIESSPWILAIHPSLPALSIRALVQLAKSRPGVLTYASNPRGSGAHLIGESLKKLAQVNLLDIPFQGETPAMVAVMSGQCDLLIAHIQPLIPQFNAHKLRALAISSGQRLEQFPQLPTLQESVMPRFELSGTQGLVVPAGTPTAVVERLSEEILRILNLPTIKNQMLREGLHLAPLNHEAYASRIRKDIENMRQMNTGSLF